MKTCHKCNIEKPLNDFHKDVARKDGHAVVCKSCKNAHQRDYTKTESGRDSQRRRDFKDVAKKRGVLQIPYKYSDIFKRDNYTCQMCGKRNLKGFDLTIDHIYPMSLGGNDCAENAQTLCRKCNRKKHNKTTWWSHPNVNCAECELWKVVNGDVQ